MAKETTFDVFRAGTGHEQLTYFQDPASGLRAIVAIYSTALGPALGGTRCYPYESTEDAVEDVLRLSRGMAYKAASAGLDLGGGKAVIIADPVAGKTEAMLRAFGRFLQALGGRFITSVDVGTTVKDMEIISRESGYVTGLPKAFGGSGDPSPLTAFGVTQAMRAAARFAWKDSALKGRHVGVLGVGKVGANLVNLLLAEGARVTVADPDPAAVSRVRKTHPDVAVAAPELLASLDLDVFAPCALGGTLDEATVANLRAQIVCGAANNQLAEPEIGKMLADRGVLYAPDYVANSAGLIQVAEELRGYSEERAREAARAIYDTTLDVFERAQSDGVPTAMAADLNAERRMREISRLRAIHLPTRLGE
jgi:valine dehydrogenase (NAD+)